MTRQELEERLIDFAASVYQVAKLLPKENEGYYYKDQIIRSSASGALNYGEALSAESSKDFIHKIKIILKELRETYVALRIIKRIRLCSNEDLLSKTIQETNELISIFVRTIQTAHKNQQK
jgi:four helix bundle protein